MEEFFREVSTFKNLPTREDVINKTYTEEQVEALDRLSSDHGMDLLSPPLIEVDQGELNHTDRLTTRRLPEEHCVCDTATPFSSTPILHGRQPLSWLWQHSMLPGSRGRSYLLRLS
jgi:hypothetical protein